MKRPPLFFLCALTLACTTAYPQTSKDTAGRAEALRLVDAWLESVQAYRAIPALSAGVVQGDDLVWSKGFGTIDANHSVAATPRTIYSICSISKLFTSVALMQLAEAGKVGLDEPITKYLPWAKIDPPSDSGPVTLRGLLTHSAGIPRESDFPYWTPPDFPFPAREAVRTRIAAQPALYPAQRHFQYSNLGLTLVGETVAAVSGKPYAEYVQTNVLTPLGLTETRIGLPMDLYGKRLAVAYGARKRDGTRDLVKTFDTGGIAPAAGYTSTVEDLATFASWQFRLLRVGGASVLKAATLREMQRLQFMDPDWKTSMGLGFKIERREDKTYVGHDGFCPGYRTILSMRPDDQTGVVVMMNSADDVEAFAKGVFAILDKRKGYEFKPPAPASGVPLEDFAGRYSEQPWDSESVIVPWAGGLAYLHLPSTDPAGDIEFLKPKAGDIFRRVRKDGSEAEEVRFVRDASGMVTSFIQHSNPIRKEAPLPDRR